tara:strand:+ start:2905 stop:3627 length:723 start_codon:yes stop_codon:yes gene_type:complete
MSLTVALIPARSGSKGVKNKNILQLNGLPLLAFSIRAALLSKEINRVIVSTDSKKYKEIALEFGAEVPFIRPKNISGDKSNDYEFVKHALNWFASKEGTIPSQIVQLRPTTPLRDPKLIDKAIREFKKNKTATALRSVHIMSESAYKCFHIKNKHLESVCTRSPDLDLLNNPRQSFSKTYQGNGYVDVLKTSYILKQNKLHGNKVMAFVTPKTFEIDTKDDFKYIEYQVLQDKNLYNRLF